MLFNSYQFIAVFLPIVLVAYYLVGNRPTIRLGWLLLASLVFYAYWDIRFVPLLILSVVVNWLLSLAMGRSSRALLAILGVAFNLFLIGVFKYLDFFGALLFAVMPGNYAPYDLVLPLGISFFTFQQISYLVDRSRGHCPAYSLLEYALYVTFFPQLIAGPIVRHNEIIQQYKCSPIRPEIFRYVGTGIVLFGIGLAKKTLLADNLAETSTPLFDQAAGGDVLSFGDSWIASMAYSLQLYFDFSGYSDMAIGLGLMFGLVLPINFNAPYRATDIQDFWRRWHMTLSRFLRDYLYIPLGGSRYGSGRLLLALMGTMFLGGLWHGAGWTFVIWGVLHGGALVLKRVWNAFFAPMPQLLAWLLLALFLLFTWVVFRAENFSTAWSIWQSMLGFHELRLVSAFDNSDAAWLILPALLIAILGPTSQDFLKSYLEPKPVYAIVTAVILFFLILNVASDGYSEFLYFQF